MTVEANANSTLHAHGGWHENCKLSLVSPSHNRGGPLEVALCVPNRDSFVRTIETNVIAFSSCDVPLLHGACASIEANAKSKRIFVANDRICVVDMVCTEDDAIISI